MKKDEIVF